jgi:heme/copper-type cytochrome/quinol oxidase subunit 2
MRILSLLGIIFVPISTVSAIFSTPFFTSTPSQDEHVVMNPEIWWLCVAALLVTLTIFVTWTVCDRRNSYVKRNHSFSASI